MEPGINNAIADMESQGFVLSMGDWKPGVNAAGVPLVLGSGELTFALNCGGPEQVLSEEQLRDVVGPRLRGIASKFRQEMFGTS